MQKTLSNEIGCPAHQIFLCPVQRHKLLVILQFPGRTEVCQLVDGAAILADHTHDVPWLYVSVNNAVLAQVVHPSHCNTQNTIWLHI